jgi:hypothetical protein
MTATAIPFLALDSNATAAEAAAKRVLFEIVRGQAILALGHACFFTWRLKRALQKIELDLEKLPAHLSPKQKETMLEVARRCRKSAECVAKAQDRVRRYHWVERMPFGSRYANNLETIHDCLEDLSETFALGANSAFTHVVRREVSEHLDSHGKPHHAA